MKMNATTEESRTDLEITVCANGVVNVRRPESDRAHSVMLAGGDVVRCSCKGYKFRGECSHADAVGSRPLIVSAATAAASAPKRVATDGGERVDDQDESDDVDDDRFRLPEDPKHVSEDDAVQDVSACPGCGRLTADDTCGRTRCEGADEIDDTPL